MKRDRLSFETEKPFFFWIFRDLLFSRTALRKVWKLITRQYWLVDRVFFLLLTQFLHDFNIFPHAHAASLCDLFLCRWYHDADTRWQWNCKGARTGRRQVQNRGKCSWQWNPQWGQQMLLSQWWVAASTQSLLRWWCDQGKNLSSILTFHQQTYTMSALFAYLRWIFFGNFLLIILLISQFLVESHTGNCLTEGLIDVTDCYYGFPIALSYPHFLDGDAMLNENITGCSPNRTQHESSFIVNPVSCKCTFYNFTSLDVLVWANCQRRKKNPANDQL